MPLNHIEQHPYLNYFIDFHGGVDQVPWRAYNRMIIGSFPVYPLTRTMYPLNNFEERFLNPNIEFPFFYGSESNDFWNYLSITCDQPNPLGEADSLLRKTAAINILENSNTILTDVIFQTNRFIITAGVEMPFSPSDAALFNEDAFNEVIDQFLYNTQILEWLINAENINNIFFTAKYLMGGKNPGAWFQDMLQENNYQIEVLDQTTFTQSWRILNTEIGFDRHVTLFFLPTPSSMRTIPLTPNHQHPFLINYIIDDDQNFYNEIFNQGFHLTPDQKEIISQYRVSLVQEWWRQYLVYNNVAFDGSHEA